MTKLELARNLNWNQNKKIGPQLKPDLKLETPPKSISMSFNVIF
jgi:hypothetical protein